VVYNRQIYHMQEENILLKKDRKWTYSKK